MGGDVNFVLRVINPAIRGRNCPICFKSLEGWSSSSSSVAVLKGCLHPYCEGCISKWSQIKRRCPLCNAQFDSWFHRPHRLGLRLHELPREGSFVISRPRVMRARWRPREHSSAVGPSRRTKALPWRRRFVGRTAEEVAERKLRWRESVYRRGIRAVPLSSGVVNTASKERVVERIGPWIRRELQAAIGDPDPTIIVHLASALYVEGEEAGCAGALWTDGDDLAPLRPFLRHWTDAFWHELGCFAGSSLTMDL